MGILTMDEGAVRVTLAARHLVGRSPLCTLKLRSSRVSSEHAAVYWEEGQWWIKDLGSRNGTFVGGRRVPAGQASPLGLGTEIEFGAPDNRWRLDHGGPPVALAVREGAVAEEVLAVGEVLGLPAGDEPLVTLCRDEGGRWSLDDGESFVPVRDLQLVTVDGQSWRLYLPDERDPTDTLGETGVRLPHVSMRFQVSRDEEHVALRVEGRTQAIELQPRAHLYTLLLLARERVKDADRAAEEQGWVDREHLSRMLAMSRNAVNTMLHRCRKQLAEAGVCGIDQLFERRPGSIRLGVTDLHVQTLGS